MVFKRCLIIIFSAGVGIVLLINMLWHFGIVANPLDHQGYYFGFTSLMMWFEDIPQDLSPAWWLNWFESVYDTLAFWASDDFGEAVLKIIAAPATIVYHIISVIVDLILLIVHTLQWLFSSLLGAYGLDMSQIPHFY